MLGCCTGAVLLGVEARPVEVEVDLSGGLPLISAVGLPDNAVREGIDRIRSALRHAGFRLPDRRVTINLAPAELRKQGTSLDLPIALAMLWADRQLPPLPGRRRAMVVGELGLDGSVRPVRGTLPIALAARDTGCDAIVVPESGADEAALVEGIEVLAVGSLADVAAHTRGAGRARPRVDVHARLAAAACDADLDLGQVRGQPLARRALEICAAGGHHLLMRGAPGAGKSMLARALPGILPPMAPREAIEVTRVWSAAGLTRELVSRRPLRAPHHTVSYAGMTGGGPQLRPGEISLANHGVLYLDELAEFRRDALESLRQPLEDGRVRLSRSAAEATFPAQFTLVGSTNPCRCGYWGSPGGRCRCTPREVERYAQRISGPLLDRFDLVVELPPVALRTIASEQRGEGSESVRQRVVGARRLQAERFGEHGPACNGRLGADGLERWGRLRPPARELLLRAGDRIGLSARGYDRVRRVARTLADLAGEPSILGVHIAEALQYRGVQARD